MHRSAAPAAAAFELAHHLGHQATGVDAAGERLTMFAVGGDNGVFRRQRLHDPDGHRLLAVVEMQESQDFCA